MLQQTCYFAFWYTNDKICLFKKLLFTIENATAADSSQSNISRIYIWKDKQKEEIRNLKNL